MDLTFLSAVLVGAGCLALGYYIGARYPGHIFISARLNKGSEVVGSGKKKDKQKEPLEIESLANILEDFKMVCSLSLSNTQKENSRGKRIEIPPCPLPPAGFGCEE